MKLLTIICGIVVGSIILAHLFAGCALLCGA